VSPGRQAQGRFLFSATVELFEKNGFIRVRQVGKHAWIVSKATEPGLSTGRQSAAHRCPSSAPICWMPPGAQFACPGGGRARVAWPSVQNDHFCVSSAGPTGSAPVVHSGGDARGPLPAAVAERDRNGESRSCLSPTRRG
jgi:hypothetical protein